MKLWIDTEFNEFKGDLISLALVDENGREFYEVLPCANPGNWVAANVMPILNKPAIALPELQRRLQNWLMHYDAIEVIADWPEDIQHFCAVLITGPGLRLNTPPLTMKVLRDLDGQSQLPHNALADAKANRLAHLTAQPAAPAVVEKPQYTSPLYFSMAIDLLSLPCAWCGGTGEKYGDFYCDNCSGSGLEPKKLHPDVAALLAELDRVRGERDEMRLAGGALSNCAFHLAMRNVGQFTARDIETLDRRRKAWDATIDAARGKGKEAGS